MLFLSLRAQIHHLSFSTPKMVFPAFQKHYVSKEKVLGGFKFKKVLRGFSVEAPKPNSDAFSGRFGSDSGGLPGCNSDFWSVTRTFGL